ncbi:MAG: hypothetical protein Q8L27_03650 [archaeon]|nr:hypothetical protein [archaeon]
MITKYIHKIKKYAQKTLDLFRNLEKEDFEIKHEEWQDQFYQQYAEVLIRIQELNERMKSNNFILESKL